LDTSLLYHEQWFIVGTLKIVGAHHEENPPAKIPYITMWQYWLGNTKPKKAFRLILNAFKATLEFKKKLFNGLTD